MKNLFFVLFFFAGLNAAAQQLPSLGALSGNQQLIEDAVKNGIFIVRRCYRLQDVTAETPTFFGWQNLNYFGETYSLAVKVKDGYYLSDRAVRPWMYDAKFEQYAENERFAPVISASEYKMTEGSIFTVLPVNSDTIKETSANRIYLAQDTAVFHQNGFFVDNSNGTKSGWLVWLVAGKPLEEDNSQTPEFMIYRSELTFEQGKDSYEIRDPATNQHIVGGFYFLPKFTDVGQINFYLCGILHHENDKWQVVRMNSTINTAPRTDAESGGLTPIVIERNDDKSDTQPNDR